MNPLHSGKTPVAPAPSILFNFHPEEDRSGDKTRNQRDTDTTRVNTFLLTLLAFQAEPTGARADARLQDVTVLFCDIAEYTRLAERASPRTCYRLVTEVMERVTACVENEKGSVVDFYGDGILVMWNAPKAQADHAARACRAALAIQAEVPALTDSWCEQAHAPLKLRCTVNSGPALVGNTGTQRRAKYGPIGHTINLAQRVQCAGKFFGLPILLTAATRSLLVGTDLAIRRLGWARLAGMAEATDLFELHADEPGWRSRREAYENALHLFEGHDWHAAARAFHTLLNVPPDQLDLASLHLLGRAIECLKAPPRDFSAAWELAGR